MSKVKDTNYINIQGWMVTQLGLSGNDLLVYAIIYGFSQDDGSMFTGSLQYLADWCNGTKQGIQKNLNKLVKSGYIQKEEYYENKVKYCNYYATPIDGIEGGEQSSLGGIQQSCMGVYNKVAWGMQQSSPYILEDKQEDINTLSKDNDTGVLPRNDTENNAVIPVQKLQEKKKKKSRYDQYIEVIEGYTDNKALREVLTEHAKLMLSMTADKPVYANQYKAIVNKLKDLSDDEDVQVKIVKQSMECGWKSFYELKQNKSYSKPNKGLQMRMPDAKSFKSREEAEEFTENLKKEAENSGRRAVF